MCSIMTFYSRIQKYVYYFAIYSFLGWVIETVFVSLTSGKFVFRGFLFGPFCTIYGFGALILIISFRSLVNRPFVVFTMSCTMLTALEYITGYILDLFFNQVLWDYSKEFLNINGRVCLKFSIIWGICSVFLLCVLHPALEFILSNMNNRLKTQISYVLLIYFLADSSSSITMALKYKGSVPDGLSMIYDLKVGIVHIKEATASAIKYFVIGSGQN